MKTESGGEIEKVSMRNAPKVACNAIRSHAVLVAGQHARETKLAALTDLGHFCACLFA